MKTPQEIFDELYDDDNNNISLTNSKTITFGDCLEATWMKMKKENLSFEDIEKVIMLKLEFIKEEMKAK